MNNEVWKKKYYFRLVLGSILFGLLLCGKEIYNDGQFNLAGIGWVVYAGAGFGILFHLLFYFFVIKKNRRK